MRVVVGVIGMFLATFFFFCDQRRAFAQGRDLELSNELTYVSQVQRRIGMTVVVLASEERMSRGGRDCSVTRKLTDSIEASLRSTRTPVAEGASVRHWLVDRFGVGRSPTSIGLSVVSHALISHFGGTLVVFVEVVEAENFSTIRIKFLVGPNLVDELNIRTHSSALEIHLADITCDSTQNSSESQRSNEPSLPVANSSTLGLASVGGTQETPSISERVVVRRTSIADIAAPSNSLTTSPINNRSGLGVHVIAQGHAGGAIRTSADEEGDYSLGASLRLELGFEGVASLWMIGIVGGGSVDGFGWGEFIVSWVPLRSLHLGVGIGAARSDGRWDATVGLNVLVEANIFGSKSFVGTLGAEVLKGVTTPLIYNSYSLGVAVIF